MRIEIFKILALLLITAAICIVLSRSNFEYALLASVIAGVIVGVMVLNNLADSFILIRDSLEEYGVNTEYFKVSIKALGIGYITNFIADTCRDSGQTSLASKAEFAGRSAIFILSVPLIIQVLKTAVGFIK
jgi:stage III sporulation protein AD